MTAGPNPLVDGQTADPVPTVDECDFSAQLTVDGQSLQVMMRGTADANVHEQFETFLTALHARAIARRAATVVIDLRGLEFINSSCLKTVVTWIFAIRAAPVEGQYRIIFIADPNARWQHRSLHSLVCIASDLVSIQD